MKKFLLSVVFLFCAMGMQGQDIVFASPQLKAKLLTSSTTTYVARSTSGSLMKIDANNDGEIQQSEALAVGMLYLDDTAIFDLSGLSYFVNLTLLDCSNAGLTSLNIAGLINLQE